MKYKIIAIKVHIIKETLQLTDAVKTSCITTQLSASHIDWKIILHIDPNPENKSNLKDFSYYLKENLIQNLISSDEDFFITNSGNIPWFKGDLAWIKENKQIFWGKREEIKDKLISALVINKEGHLIMKTARPNELIQNYSQGHSVLSISRNGKTRSLSEIALDIKQRDIRWLLKFPRIKYKEPSNLTDNQLSNDIFIGKKEIESLDREQFIRFLNHQKLRILPENYSFLLESDIIKACEDSGYPSLDFKFSNKTKSLDIHLDWNRAPHLFVGYKIKNNSIKIFSINGRLPNRNNHGITILELIKISQQEQFDESGVFGNGGDVLFYRKGEIINEPCSNLGIKTPTQEIFRNESVRNIPGIFVWSIKR